MNVLTKDNPAWMILAEEERLALTLHYGADKSTWQAGEIMKKAHYKYLEIRARGEKFLKMFTEYFELYGDLFPQDLIISSSFRKYLLLVIVKRKRVNKVIREIGNPQYLITSSRDQSIIGEMSKFKNSRKISERNFYNLIMDFDRWNNFRILPKGIQEPSAFKRRDKNRHRKYLKILINMHPFSVREIIKRYEFESKASNVKHIAYITIIKDVKKAKYKIVPIHAIKSVMDEISRIGIYIFKDRQMAEVFIEIVLRYYDKEVRHCTDGQKFWPQYRLLIKKAINYNPVQNIIPSRKYLEYAMRDVDPSLVSPKKGKRKNREKRVEGEEFWG